jgi:DNA-binding transcriptional LysR family regulator
MDQQSLEDLLAFIELRNITLAANRRNISQPAYSRRLEAIEAFYDIALVDRSGRPSVPTRALNAMQEEIELALIGLKRVGKSFAGNSGFNRTIHIAAVHSISVGPLPVAISKIEKQIDKLGIRLHSANQDICFRLLMTEEVSVMLAYESVDQPLQAPLDLVKKTIVSTDQLVPVCNIKLARQLRDLLANNATIPLITYPVDIFLGRLMYHDVLARSPYVFSTKLVAGMTSVVSSAVSAGLGIAWLPASVIKGQLHNKELVIIDDVGFPKIDLTIAMLQLRRKDAESLSELWSALVEALADAVGT